MTSTIITDYIGRGLHVDRPVSPPVSSGATAIYFETDTNTTFVWSGSVWVEAYSGSTVGTVTSVAVTVPGELNLSGSPITASGTFALSWANQTGNVVLASPSGGGSGTPGFRNLVSGDIPNLSTSILTSGQLALARGGTALDASAAANGELLIGTGSGFSLSTLTAGSNITITNASGMITIASTGGGGGGSTPGASILYGPYVIDFTDFSGGDGSTKDLWTPAVGDVLLRFFVDWNTVTQFDNGCSIFFGPGVDGAADTNVVAVGGIGDIGGGNSSDNLDSIGTAMAGSATNGSGLGLALTATVFSSTAPFRAYCKTPFGAPTMGHIEVYALIATPIP